MVLAKVMEKICVCVHARVREYVLYLQSVCLLLPTHGENFGVANLQNSSQQALWMQEPEKESTKRTANGKDKAREKRKQQRAPCFFI